MLESTNRTYDASLVLEDGTTGVQTSDFTASAAFLDLGAYRVHGEVVIQWTTCKTSAGNEEYRLILQGSDDSGFSSGTEVELAITRLGGATALEGADTATAATGKEVFGFDNVVAGTAYRYVRLRVEISGTSPSFTLANSFLSIRHR